MPTQTTVKEQLSIAELSALYDRIYDIADRLFKKYNPCNIYTVSGGIGCTDRKTGFKFGLCCSGCKYLSKEGCTIKCLPCKLFVCTGLTYSSNKNGRETRNEKYRNFVDRLDRLRQIASKSGIWTREYFKTKSEILKTSKRRNKIW